MPAKKPRNADHVRHRNPLAADYEALPRTFKRLAKSSHIRSKCVLSPQIEVKQGKTWYAYITSVLDPQILPPYVVADLYARRWRIEEAFNTAKRLLGLSYLWTGSIPWYQTSSLGYLVILRSFN